MICCGDHVVNFPRPDNLTFSVQEKISLNHKNGTFISMRASIDSSRYSGTVGQKIPRWNILHAVVAFLQELETLRYYDCRSLSRTKLFPITRGS